MLDNETIRALELCMGNGNCELIELLANSGCSADLETYQEIAGHLLANGVIVPPCKVGDTVYSFCDVFGAMLPYVIQDFKIGFMGKDRPNYWYWEATSHATETDELLDEIDFDLDDIGKTVFLAKEEAEKALAERSKNV